MNNSYRIIKQYILAILIFSVCFTFCCIFIDRDKSSENNIFKIINLEQKNNSDSSEEIGKLQKENEELKETIKILRADNYVAASELGATFHEKLFSIISPDQKYQVFLRKIYDAEISRYTKQSIVLMDIASKKETVLSSMEVSKEEALTRYGIDGCNNSGECCVSKTGFNEFRPLRWITNDLILIEEYQDNYECSGAIGSKKLFNIDGSEFFTEAMIKPNDYSTKNDDSLGWYVGNVCVIDNDRFALITQKSIFGGYSYAEVDVKNKRLSNQKIEKSDFEPEEGESYYDISEDCSIVSDSEQMSRRFE